MVTFSFWFYRPNGTLITFIEGKMGICAADRLVAESRDGASFTMECGHLYGRYII